MMLDSIFYMYSNMDGSSQMLLLLIVLVALMLVSICVINVIIKKKNEKYDKMFNPINKYNNVVKKEKKEKDVKPIEIKKEHKEPKTIDYTLKEEKQVQEEIEVMEDPEVIEVVSENNSIEKIATLIEDNLNNQTPIDLTEFEEEEEKNAIISYDELVKKAGAKKIVYKTEKATINEEIKQEQIEIKPEVKSKFKASQVISPIYGIKKQKQAQEEHEEFIDLENMDEQNKKYIDEDLQKDITFLTSLKSFRNNLD